MTTQADIELVIDRLDQVELEYLCDVDTVQSAVIMLETLGNQAAAQAAVIEKLRGALKFYANPASDTFGNTARMALDTPTDSTQILQEWLDSVMGDPFAFETSDYKLVHRTTRQDIVPLFKKPEKL